MLWGIFYFSFSFCSRFFSFMLCTNNVLYNMFYSSWLHFSTKMFFCPLIVVYSDCRFDIFKPMHEMWKDYIMLLLKSTGYIFCIISVGLINFSFLSSDCPAKREKNSWSFILQEKSIGSMSPWCRSTWCFYFRFEHTLLLLIELRTPTVILLYKLLKHGQYITTFSYIGYKDSYFLLIFLPKDNYVLMCNSFCALKGVLKLLLLLYYYCQSLFLVFLELMILSSSCRQSLGWNYGN